MMFYPDLWYYYNQFRSILMIVLFCFLLAAFLGIAGKWLIFKKAGMKGWYSIIPFYNRYVIYKLTWGNGWLFLAPLILGLFTNLNKLGWVFWLFSFAIQCMSAYKLSLSFGHSIGYAIGLVFLDPVFLFLLGVDSSFYHGIPQDGFTYEDIRGLFSRYSSDHMEYVSPDADKKTDDNIVDAEFEEKQKEDK